jgi:hypothetical protein
MEQLQNEAFVYTDMITLSLPVMRSNAQPLFFHFGKYRYRGYIQIKLPVFVRHFSSWSLSAIRMKLAHTSFSNAKVAKSSRHKFFGFFHFFTTETSSPHLQLKHPLAVL